jgi:hypothetical protein
LPGYNYLTVYKDLYSVFGGELDWFYGSRGIYTFTNEIFSSFAYYKTESRDRDQMYEFEKDLLMGDAFTDWKSYNHPTYGDIEIGGFRKNIGRATPGFMLEEELHRNMAFTFYHAFHMPRLSVDNVNEKSLGGGLTEITAYIKNDRLIPTHASQDLKYKITRPDYISIKGVNVISGMIVTDEDFGVTVEQKNNPEVIEVKNIPGNDIVKVRWIVKGNSNYSIHVDSEKGGLTTHQKK